jgi:hypothetical protein
VISKVFVLRLNSFQHIKVSKFKCLAISMGLFYYQCLILEASKHALFNLSVM